MTRLEARSEAQELRQTTHEDDCLRVRDETKQELAKLHQTINENHEDWKRTVSMQHKENVRKLRWQNATLLSILLAILGFLAAALFEKGFPGFINHAHAQGSKCPTHQYLFATGVTPPGACQQPIPADLGVPPTFSASSGPSLIVQGTTSPANDGQLKINSPSGNLSYLSLAHINGTPAPWVLAMDGGRSDQFDISENGTVYFAITTTGNVTLGATGLTTTIPSKLIVNGDALFASGRPWLDVRAFGAVKSNPSGFPGNGTDNTTAIQNAINAMESTFGQANIFVPSDTGQYCVRGGLTTSQADTIHGELSINFFGSILSTCDGNVTLLEMTQGGTLYDLTLEGYQAPQSTASSWGGSATTIPAHPTLQCDGGCRMDRLSLSGGTHAFYGGVNFADVTIRDVYAQYAYGSSIMYMRGGGRWEGANKFDQNFPVGPSYTFPMTWTVNGSNTTSPTTWAPSTAYSLGAIVLPTNSNGMELIATVAGTSASSGSGPLFAPYLTNITDGTVTWQLLMPVNESAVQFDTGAQSNEVRGIDTIAAVQYAVSFTNTLSGNPPRYIDIFDSTLGGFLNGVNAAAGQNSRVVGSVQTGLFLTGAAAINIGSSWLSDLQILGGSYFGTMTTGIKIGGGSNTIIKGALIQPTGTSNIGVDILAAPRNTIVSGNTIPASNVGIQTETGADYYSIQGNICGAGVTTCFNDIAAGAHKYAPAGSNF